METVNTIFKRVSYSEQVFIYMKLIVCYVNGWKLGPPKNRYMCDISDCYNDEQKKRREGKGRKKCWGEKWRSWLSFLIVKVTW